MQTTTQGKSRRTAWELADLVRPLHRKRQRRVQRPRLLKHFAAVVEFVYQHRFVTRHHIQRRFANFMQSDRTAQHQLGRMVELKLLKVAPVRSTSPHFPAVFAATRQGIKLVRETYAQLGYVWNGSTNGEQVKHSGLALVSVMHELLLTEFDQAVQATLEATPHLELVYHERRYFGRTKQLRYTARNGAVRYLSPDSGFLVRSQTNSTSLPKSTTLLPLYLVEADNGTMSITRLAEKYQGYLGWASSDEARQYLSALIDQYGRDQDDLDFRLLLIVNSRLASNADEKRLIDVIIPALDLPRAMRDRVFATTVSRLRQHQHDPLPLAAPIWLRLRDARHWMPAYRRQFGDKPQHRQIAAKRAFVDARINHLPRHSLFPQSI